jgi:diguanylate cyclase (GGDEF)-like protein
VGDDVLKMLSSTIKGKIRSDDLVGRWGGEEFVAVLHVRNTKELEMIAEKLRVTIEESYVTLNDGTKVYITVSIGGTMYINSEEVNIMIDRSDQAMYKAKETGRNRVVVT